MKNRYSKGAHISEARFREVIRFFAADLPSLTASELTSLNYRFLEREEAIERNPFGGLRGTRLAKHLAQILSVTQVQELLGLPASPPRGSTRKFQSSG